MKKVIFGIFLLSNVIKMNAQTTLKNVRVLGSFSFGDKEITTFEEEFSGCLKKSNPHAHGLFVANEALQIEVLENEEMAEVLKPNLVERIYVNKNCESNAFDYLDLTSDAAMLVFKTVEDYENMITTGDYDTEKDIVEKEKELLNLLSKVNFERFINSDSYKELVLSGRNEDYPELILQMLNTDGAIQIGDHIFRLDFINEKAYSLPVNFKSTEYNKLVAGQNGNSHVIKYPWNKEIVYDAHDFNKSGCNEVNAPTKQDPSVYTDKIEWNLLFNADAFEGTYNVNVTHKKFDGKLIARYRWTPIGWDLYSKVVLREKEQTGGVNSNGVITFEANWSTADVELKLEWRRNYKRKCVDNIGWGNIENSYGTGIATGQSYRGLGALNKYFMGANAYARIDGVWQLLAFGDKVMFAPLGNAFQVMINHGY